MGSNASQPTTVELNQYQGNTYPKFEDPTGWLGLRDLTLDINDAFHEELLNQPLPDGETRKCISIDTLNKTFVFYSGADFVHPFDPSTSFNECELRQDKTRHVLLLKRNIATPIDAKTLTLSERGTGIQRLVANMAMPSYFMSQVRVRDPMFFLNLCNNIAPVLLDYNCQTGIAGQYAHETIMVRDCYKIVLIVNGEAYECKFHTLHEFVYDAFELISKEENPQWRDLLFNFYYHVVIHTVTQALLGANAAAALGIEQYGLYSDHVLMRNPYPFERQFSHFCHKIQAESDPNSFRHIYLPVYRMLHNERMELPIAEITDFRHATVSRHTATALGTPHYELGDERSAHDRQVDTQRHTYGRGYDPVALVSSVLDKFKDVATQSRFAQDMSDSIMRTTGIIGDAAWFTHSLYRMSNYMRISEQDEVDKEGLVQRVHSVFFGQEDNAPKSVVESYRGWSCAQALLNFSADTGVAVDDLEGYNAYVKKSRTQSDWIRERVDISRKYMLVAPESMETVYSFYPVPYEFSFDVPKVNETVAADSNLGAAISPS